MQAIIFLWVLLLAASGNAQQNCQNCGVIYSRVRVFNPELNDYVPPKYGMDVRRLFYDSISISERYEIVSNVDSKNHETWQRRVIGYVFWDLRTWSFYYYENFSDTARFLWSKREPERRSKKGSNNLERLRIPHKSILLSDTVLDGTRCGRLRGLWFEKGDTVLVATMYYVSEKDRPIEPLNKTIVNGQRVSVIREDDFDVASKRKAYSSADVVSHNLTKEELEVFAAWKRNLQKYPAPIVK